MAVRRGHGRPRRSRRVVACCGVMGGGQSSLSNSWNELAGSRGCLTVARSRKCGSYPQVASGCLRPTAIVTTTTLRSNAFGELLRLSCRD